MRRHLVLLLILFSNLLAAYPDSLFAVQQLECARQLASADEGGAMGYMEESFDVFQKNNDLYNWYNWHQKMGKTWREDRQDPYKALDIFHAGLDRAWRRPGHREEFIRLAWLLAETGRTHEKSLKDFLSTRDYYLQASQIFADTLGIEDFNVAKYIYTNLGNAYTRLRDFENAEYYLGKVKDISWKAEKWNKWVEACSDLSKIFFNTGEYSKAVETLSEGLKMEDSISFRAKKFLLSGLCIAYYRTEDYKKALKYAARAKTEINNAPGISSGDKASYLHEIYVNYGRIYRALKSFEQAEACFFKAGQILEKEFENPDKRALAFLEIYSGQLYLDWKKPEKALECYQDALKQLVSGFLPSGGAENPFLKTLPAESLVAIALEGKAQSFIDMHRNGAPLELVEKAVECFDLAEAVNALLWQTYILEGSRLTAAKDRRRLKEASLEASFYVWQQKGSGKWEEKMFALSEKSRALLLTENLELARAFENENTQGLRSQYVSLNRNIGRLEYALFHAPEKPGGAGQPGTDSLQRELLKAKEKRAAAIGKVAALLPEAGLGGRHKSIAAAEAGEGLKDKQALIEYFVAERNVYIFIIGPKQEGLSIKRVDWDEAWAQKARTIKEDICGGKKDAVSYVLKARALYDHLVKPVLEATDAKNFIIVPDGELWNIPFGALLTRDIDEAQLSAFRVFPYLIREKCISYAFSASMLQGGHPGGSPEKVKLLAYAPSYRDIKKGRPASSVLIASRKQLDTLIFNQQEATSIADIWGGESICEEKATKEHFLKSASGANVLHVAAHAKADNHNPNFSYIAFTNMGDTLQAPYKLYVHELYNHRLPFEMAVLSACETGTGPVWKGEGLISIARAFAYGGAKSIVTSLWSIPDESAKDIMVLFYDNLKKGYSKDEALREAKLAYIEKSAHLSALPAHWAAFTAIGNMEALPAAVGSPVQNACRGWIVFLVLASAMALLFAARKKVVPLSKHFL